MTYQQLQVLHAEAIRQRTSKYSLLALLINKPNQKDEDQRKINRQLDKYMNPHGVQSEDSSGWDNMRDKRNKLVK